MESSDAAAFNAAWAGAWDAYGRNQTAAGIKIAFKALADLDWPTVRAALTAHIRESPREPPTAGAIRERIDGDVSQHVHLAWSKLRRAMRLVGPYRSVAFDDACIHAVVRDLGGWPGVCEWRHEQMPFEQARFERAYRAYRGRGGRDAPAYLAGIAETANRAAGFAVDPPSLIGDAAAANAVAGRGPRDDRAGRAVAARVSETCAALAADSRS